MITTRRETIDNDVRNEARSRLGLLDRKPVAYNEAEAYATDFEETIDKEEDKRRMSENFNLLLNYEKYIEEKKQQEQLEKASAATVVEEPQIAEAAAYEQVAAVNAATISKEDITPTSTTMQFGTDDVGSLYSDMKKDEKTDAKFRLSAHSKIMIAVYAIVVTVIMALIIINTSVLASLRAREAASAAKLERLTTEYNALEEELNEVSSDKHVIEIAEGEYNMVKSEN